MVTKTFQQSFTKADLDKDGNLTLTYTDSKAIINPLFAVIKYNQLDTTFINGLSKISDASCKVNVSECPNGTHSIHIIYKT